MNLQEYLDSMNITKYHLSRISGVPKTTITDICSGKSDIEKCSARTVMLLVKALNLTMEELIAMTKTACPRIKATLNAVCLNFSGTQ